MKNKKWTDDEENKLIHMKDVEKLDFKQISE